MTTKPARCGCGRVHADDAPATLEIAETARLLAGRVTELTAATRGLSTNSVLLSGTWRIPAPGYITWDFAVPMGAVAVWAEDSAAGVTAAAAPPAGAAPSEGVGVVALDPGAFACVPMTGNSLTIYGAVGDLVYAGAWSRAWPPVVSTAVQAPVVAEPIPGVSGFIGSATSTYYGFSLRETAGAAATVRLRAGGATGAIVEAIDLAPNESAREFYPGGVAAPGGVYVELVAGAVQGTIRHSGD